MNVGLETGDIPLSLYVHFPWCVRKCPYCDFNSHAATGEVPEDRYIDALLRDLAFECALAGIERPLRSIFIGGGTPSLISGGGIARLVEHVQRQLPFAPDIEVTLEANPGTADAANFRDYRRAGVNRLSIGVQSLNAGHLKALGRIHGPDEARKAVALARDAGFENINLDLMYALPGQTLAEAAADLDGVLALGPEHVSYYQLTLEPNTEFHARPPPLPDHDLSWEMQLQGQQVLADAGYAQYEVSAYARAGRQCRHNRNYWEFGDYLGVGAGAHGKRTEGGTVRRRARHKHPRHYQQHAGSAFAVQEDRVVESADFPFEYAMNALRLNEGTALADFERRTGLAGEAISLPMAEGRRRGWLDPAPHRLCATAQGRAMLNPLVGLFLP